MGGRRNRGRRRHGYHHHGDNRGPPHLHALIEHQRPAQGPAPPVIVPERIPLGRELPVAYVPFYQEQRFREQMPQHRRRTIEGEVHNVQRVAHAVANACEAVLGVFAEIRNAGWMR